VPHQTQFEKRSQIESAVKLSNERSRLKHALQFTWERFAIPAEVQAKMLDCIREGNRMSEFETTLGDIARSTNAGEKH
jgi:hypothetical protein